MDSELETIRRSLTTGALLDNRDFGLALKIFRMFVENRGLNRADVIALNGFPRHVGQAEGLEGIVNIEKVVFLDGSDEVIKERLRLDTGGDRESRSDGDEAVARRLSIFRERTLTLLTYYQNREVPVVRIAVEARMSAEEMSNRLIS
jgi:adenylate kinase family enzyme